MSSIDQIIKKIGIPKGFSDYFVFQENKWINRLPIRLHKGLIEINPHSFLLLENKIIALFFILSPKNIAKITELFKKIWNLGGCPTVFLISEETVDIYNGFSFDTQKSIFDKLKFGNKQITIDNIESEFSIWELISGRGFDKLPAPKAIVDEKLLENLENTKNILVKTGLENEFAQNLIGRLLFSRYLLDRGVKVDSKYFEDNSSFLNLIKNKKRLYEYFDYLKVTFNGDLFPVGKDEIKVVTNAHLDYLYELFSGSDIEKTGSSIQKSLFDMYNFKIIPIEMISEVYERFIGQKDQKEKAAYYTPSFLVDYILEKTVKLHLNNNKTCKVFDPSCGSGIFLVETLRSIIEKNLKKNCSFEKKDLHKLLTDNIFGVDIDSNAVNLTIFSLCLTLLDYVDPKDITTFKFPTLLNNNLFIADYFDTTHQFNQKIKNIDFILGNPPWGSDKTKDSHHINYFTKNGIPVSDKQLAQSFIVRSKDFSQIATKCALVLPSKPILYNHNAIEYRKYFLTNFYLDEILELSSVRQQIFSGAVAPTVIIFFNFCNNENTENNTVLHTSIKPNIFLERLKLLVIEKSDIKQIKQLFFLKYDYLWKILLYGNIFDFYLINRLRDDYKNIYQIIDEKKLSFGLGFQLGGKPTDGTHLLGKLYIDTKKNALTKFFINRSYCKKWEINKIHRPRTKDIYKPPYVLLKRAFDRQNFSLIAAYTEDEYVFSNLITAIRGTDKPILKTLTGILNSTLYSYFLLLQGSSAGIEREESFNEERFQFPYIFNNEIAISVDKMHDLYKKNSSEIMYNAQIELQIADEEKKLNGIILDSFKVTNIEKAFIDYAINVTIPLVNNKKEPLVKSSEKQLKTYAKIFADHFGERWNSDSTFFEIDIYYNEYVIGINFKIVERKPSQIINLCKNKNVNELYNLIRIGEEKITDIFFKQKDIRGFNETSFYIIKPNQYKNWHPAMAYGDLSEFVEAMLQAEMPNGKK
jgi:hypothetical protein